MTYATKRAQGVHKMYFILVLYIMLDKVSTGFQNVPQNGRIEHTIITHPAGGRSRFVLTLFSTVNKTGTNHEHPKCCKIVTLLHTGHRPSVAKLSHCCRWDTLLQNCHTVADRQRWTIVFTMWHIGKILECVCACTYNVFYVYVHGISFCYI